MATLLQWLLILLILAVHAPAGLANPMPRNGPVAIGMLGTLWAPTGDMLGVRDGLVALGYQSDVDVAFGVRFAAGRTDQLEPILRQLLSNGAHLLYVSDWNVLQAARRVTTQTPIVFTTWYPPAPDEIAPGSTALGDNVTGVTHAFPDVNPEALERFRALIPTLQRVLVPYDAHAPPIWRSRCRPCDARHRGWACNSMSVQCARKRRPNRRSCSRPRRRSMASCPLAAA